MITYSTFCLYEAIYRTHRIDITQEERGAQDMSRTTVKSRLFREKPEFAGMARRELTWNGFSHKNWLMWSRKVARDERMKKKKSSSKCVLRQQQHDTATPKLQFLEAQAASNMTNELQCMLKAKWMCLESFFYSPVWDRYRSFFDELKIEILFSSLSGLVRSRRRLVKIPTDWDISRRRIVVAS